MSKRGAQSELNHENWDQEDEEEEAGEFKQASKDILQSRQIIKAKRKSTLSTEGGNSSFGGFSGFSFKPTTTSTPFSFNVKSVTNGKSADSEESDKPPVMANTEVLKSTNGQTKEAKDSQSSDQSSTYSENLKKLNESVLAWIKSHVEKNPYCILTPIFKDYEKHLENLEKDKKSNTVETSLKPPDSSQPCTGLKSNADTGESTGATNTISTTVSFGSTSSSFGQGFKFTSNTTDTTTATATNGSSTSTMSGFGFSFKPAPTSSGDKPAFSFAVNPPKSTEGGGSQDAEEEEYVPPKPESTEIEEEGSLYSIKCKLYYQKEGNWTERGVGFLHLKKSDEKLQLVIRADTSLGNILLNIMVPSSMPVKRQGKNNLSFMCVPNPPVDPKADPKPTPMLIRVKTGEDADTLLEKIEEFRN